MKARVVSGGNFSFCRNCGFLLSSFEVGNGCSNCLDVYKRRERDSC